VKWVKTISLVLIVALSSPSLAGVYRWVDENGVVNYGSAPPRTSGNSTASAPKVDRITGSNTSASVKFPQVPLERGTWWGSYDQFFYAIKFERNTFDITAYDRTGEPSHRYAAGNYVQQEGGIMVDYRYHHEHAHLVGDEILLPVQVVDDHHWRAAVTGRDDFSFHKQWRLPLEGLYREVYGVWSEASEPHILYHFGMGSLEKRYSRSPPGRGYSRVRQVFNLSWDKPHLTLTPVVDIHRPDNLDGTEEIHWRIENRTSDVMEILDVDAQKRFVLRRR